MRTTETWRDVGRRQGEAVSRRQLLRAGLTRGMVEHRCRRGLLWPRHPGVFAIGRPDLDEYGRAWAAFLATRGRGDVPHARALAGRSALAQLGHGSSPLAHEIVVLNAELVVPGVTTHRTRHLPRSDLMCDANGLVFTTWPRTLIDLARLSSVAELESIISSLADARTFELGTIDAALATAAGRQGLPKLHRALEPYRGLTTQEHRSLLERLAHRALRDAGLPEPEINAPLVLPDGRPIVVDLLYREERVAIEVDGRTWHARAAAFTSDRARDRALQTVGYAVPRFTWWEARRRPQMVARDVRRLLDRPR